MKRITKILALVLVLALALTLAACGSKSSSSDSIVGTWKCELDFDKILAEMPKDASTDASMLDTMTKCFEGLSMTIILDLQADNTFTLCTDEKTMTEVSGTLAERLPDLLGDLVAAMVGMTREEYEAALAEQGMTMGDALAEFGDMFDPDSMLDSMTFPAKTGTYTYEGGKLTLTADDETVVYTIKLSGNELQITDVESGEDVLPEDLMPLVFTK